MLDFIDSKVIKNRGRREFFCDPIWPSILKKLLDCLCKIIYLWSLSKGNMRKVIYLFLSIFTGFFLISLMSFAQIHPYIPPIVHSGPGIYSDYPCGDSWIGVKPDPGPIENHSVLSDPSTMVTYYDMQTLASLGDQRLYYWPADNTMAACATWSPDSSNSLYTFPNRGTGYNYFNGTQWGPKPATRVESVRTGWPSIQPYGINGECILSHQGAADSLVFLKRSLKGTGTWTETFVPNPSGQPGMLWPKMVTSGLDHMSVQVLALTPPTFNGGIPYNGMDGALLYIRSTDGGVTWGNWIQLTGMTTSEYLSFDGDTYAWANPRGDMLCFFVCNSTMDAFIMKSTDNGTNWTKTVIYNSPYNLSGTGSHSPGFFYCPDGSCDVAMDKTGMAHVTFALECDSVGGPGLYHQRWTNGIVYWNESMPPLGQDLNPEVLFANNQLIGWVTDTMVFHQPDYVNPGGYFGAIAGTPTMAIDDNNNLFVAWMNPTTILDPDFYMLTHIFERTATIYPGYGVYWHDSINDLTESPEYNFKECVFPSLSPTTSQDRFHIMFQCDDLAGAYVIGIGSMCYNGQYTKTDNNLIVMSKLKSDVGVGINNSNEDIPAFIVTDNSPNPCHSGTTILVTSKESGNLSLQVTNVIGQRIYFFDKGLSFAGSNRFPIDLSNFKPGIYFYTVRLDERSITKKMIVD
jgi:Secretion system C-terminal sorting domain